MIDNVLNNEKPKEEKEKQSGRISIKEKLAEKKEVTRQRDKAEINLMCVFEGQDKEVMIAYIKNIIPRIQDSDMVALAGQVLGKLENMSDAEFAEAALGYCSHATIPRGVSAHFVRKSRVFQREIASFCDFCASRSALLVTE